MAISETINGMYKCVCNGASMKGEVEYGVGASPTTIQERRLAGQGANQNPREMGAWDEAHRCSTILLK